MKVQIGIGLELSFYVLREDSPEVSATLHVERSTDPEMFIWLTQYFLDHNKDPTKEYRWYEIEL